MIGWLLVSLLAQAPPSTLAARPLKPKIYRGTPPQQSQIGAAREKAKARGLALSGVQVPLHAKALAKGNWHKLADGRAIWLLQVESPGAKALRFQFRDFAVGTGKVWVHAEGEAGGPYTGRGPHEDGEFWSETIHSAIVTLEFVPGAVRPAKLPFRIETISHQL